MAMNLRRKDHGFYRMKVCLFFWATIAFILGYVCGIMSSYLANDTLIKTTEKTSSVMSTSRYHEISSFLTVGILSGAKNIARRQVIRKTWLQKIPQVDVHHVFVIGTLGLDDVQLASLQSEQAASNDLLYLENVHDSYQHLSEKLLNYLVWLDKTVNFTYVLKCDDDSFVHMENIYYELSRMQGGTKFYWGFFDGRAHVKKKGRWNEKNWFLCDRYLPYAVGGGYVLSKDIVSFIAKNSDTLMLYNSEDVSMGVWTAALKITRNHDPRFDTEFESRGCFNSYLVTHKQTIEQMKNKQISLQKTGVMCSQEFRNKKSYIYNWSVVPSMCCIRNNSKVP